MPASEAFFKDILFGFSDFFLWLKNGGRLPVILVYPDFPSKKTTIRKIARELGFRITNKPIEKPEVVMYFEDVTHGSSQWLSHKYPNFKIFNQDCTDISKKKVDEVHQRVFGYHTIIDPLTYLGVAVQKSDINALHDGKVVQCPITELEAGSVYQVLIDNSAEAGMVMDFRVPVIACHAVLAYKKFKAESVRFTNQVSYSELHDHTLFFDEQELQQIGRFCREMGADFCELDILRNKTDGRIYIIDVNKTPYGPPYGLSHSDAENAIRILSKKFSEMILQPH